MVFYQSCLREQHSGSKKNDNFCKKGVDKREIVWYDTDCSAKGRVPCKLNNERNEKHQTGAQKCATRSLREVPGLVNYREKRKDKKF